jgi:hypothetical protein
MRNRFPKKAALTRLAIVLVLAVAGWRAGLETAWAETITGTFRYADFNPANNTTQLRPIQFCKVEVWGFRPRFLGIWGWAKDADTTTDANGAINVSINFDRAGVVYGVRVTAQNYGAVVWPNQFAALDPFWQEPGFPDGAAFQRIVNAPGDVVNFSYDFTDSFTPQHWSLADAVRQGFDYVSARRDPAETDPLRPAPVQPGFFTTFYNPVNQTLEINDAHVWEDFTILHEYAHYVEHQISHFVAIPTVHDGCATRDAFGGIVNSAEHAWMEGFAEFFAQVVAAHTPAGVLRGHAGDFGTFSVSDLENTPWARCTGLPPSVTPNMIENIVAGVLWDLFDGEGACFSGEAHDGLAGFDTIVMQILDREMDRPQPPTIGDFSSAWFARGLPAMPFFEILLRHGLVPCQPHRSPAPAISLPSLAQILAKPRSISPCPCSAKLFVVPSCSANLRPDRPSRSALPR